MQLKRQFGVWTAVALIVGQVIAVGIFLTPAGMAKSVGSPFWLLVIWVVLGLMTLSGALCYGELASRFPEAGGSYVYLRESFGKAVAFLYSWTVLVLLDPGLTAAFAVGTVSYASYFLPLSPIGKQITAILIVLVIGTINIVGAKVGANFLKFFTLLKVSTLLFIVFYGFFGGLGNWSNFTPFFSQPDDFISALAVGIVGAYIAFAGWWDVTKASGEIENPEKNLPKALAIGVGTVMVIYILTSAVFFYLVPVSQVASDETFAAQAGEALFGKIGGVIFASIVVVSVLASLFAYLMAAPRVYYAMAKDGLFFKSFGELHPKFNTPHRATLIQMFLAIILIPLGSYMQIISYFLFATVVFIALSVAGLFIIRKQEFNGYKTPLYPITPIFYLTLTALVLVMIAIKNPWQSFIGIGVVLLGLPIYYLIFKVRERGTSK